MTLEITATCPHCGHDQTQDVDLAKDHMDGQEIIRCNKWDGGCDEYYAVFYTVNVAVSSYTIGREATPCGKLY